MPNSIILPSSRLAVTYWYEMKDKPIRVFFQDISGGVREFHYLQHLWGGGKPGDVKFNAKKGSPLAIISWKGFINASMRIFYHDSNNKIREHCWDESRGWFPGAEVASAEPGSGLAALRWEGPFSSYQRVYYKAPHHDGICEAQYDGSDGTWKTITLPVSDASPTTSLAAVKHENGIWVFYQNRDGIVREVVCNSGHWGQGGLWQPAKKGTPLATTLMSGTVLLYHLSDGNEIREHCFTRKEWYPGDLDVQHLAVSPESSLGAVWAVGARRVYYRAAGAGWEDKVREYGAVDHGHWAPTNVMTAGN